MHGAGRAVLPLKAPGKKLLPAPGGWCRSVTRVCITLLAASVVTLSPPPLSVSPPFASLLRFRPTFVFQDKHLLSQSLTYSHLLP